MVTLKNNKMKYIFLFTLLSLQVNAQRKIDANSVFKMWLYLDKETIHSKYNHQTNKIERLTLKNDSLYNAFNEVVSLDIESIKSKGFNNDYSFYSLEVFKSLKGLTKSVSHIREVNDIESDLFHIGHGSDTNDQFIIAINNATGRSYRIIGFLNSDFLNFMYDFQENSKDELNINISIHSFLKEYSIDGVDFSCLYKGLRDKRDYLKYPCIKSCYQPTSSQ
jgi:hypothetical protein